MRFKLVHLSFLLICKNSIIAQDATQKINSLDQQLSKGSITISRILSDPSNMNLHSLTSFREMIKKYAKAETITIVTPDEPGKKILVKGTITDPTGNPQKNKLVYFYQTSDKGWYSDTGAHVLIMEGDRRHARLFGYIKTDENGDFSFNTIQPRGYPRSSLPAHIHLELKIDDNSGLGTELLFDDDPRLVGEIRTNAIRERFYISKNTGTEEKPVYAYKITTR